MRLSEQFIIIKKYEPFVIGSCHCGCGTNIPIRSKIRCLQLYCKGHYQKTTRGKKKGRFKKGYYWMLSGYYDHPNANKEGKIFEHILVMSQHLGRPLEKGEYVHHIDPVRKGYCNNMIWNLLLVSRSEHNKIHFTKKDISDRRCMKCGSDETYYHEDTDHYHWHGNEKDGWKCNKCYFKELNKKRREYKRNWDRKKRSS